MAWTPEGKPAWREGADGARETWTWDGEGNLTAHTDQAGHTTRSTYTHFELVATRADPDGRIHSFAYDTELRLTAVTNPQGLTWTYSYDPVGRLAAETDFDGRTLAYAYDAAGRLASRTDPLGRTTSFERDALGQVVRKRAGDRMTTFAYDPAGRLTAAANPDAEIGYVRDRLGQVTSEATAGRVLTHAYDAVGRPVHRTTPSGAVTTYAYNAAGHRTLLTAGDHSLDFTHDAIGRETARRIDNALTLSQSWDVAGRLREQHLTAASTGVVQGRAYTYRSDGHLTGVHDRGRLRVAGNIHHPLHRAGRHAAQGLPAPGGGCGGRPCRCCGCGPRCGGGDQGGRDACVRGEASPKTGQESRSPGRRAAPSVMVMATTASTAANMSPAPVTLEAADPRPPAASTAPSAWTRT
jgi:YD repeat-containing protein